MISNIVEDDDALQCDMNIDVKTANTLRCALLEDIGGWAASSVMFTTNTLCMPDEYIAHRLGMLPFAPSGAEVRSTELRLCVSDRDVSTDDLIGDFVVSPLCKLMSLASGQTLECTVTLHLGYGRDHKKHCMVSGVGYEEVDDGKGVRFRLETIQGTIRPMDHLIHVCDSLRAHIK
jgi:DNA-directed RNA polymerase alpha subunit|eukprot:5886303-Prymnesium_polylepis.2